MAATPGHKVKLYKGGVLVAGVRTKNMTVNNESVDITSDDDDGFRTFMARSGQKNLDISVEGVAKDSVFLNEAIAGSDLLTGYTLVFEDFANYTITGDFRIANVQFGAQYKEAVTFSAEMNSSGAYTGA